MISTTISTLSESISEIAGGATTQPTQTAATTSPIKMYFTCICLNVFNERRESKGGEFILDRSRLLSRCHERNIRMTIHKVTVESIHWNIEVPPAKVKLKRRKWWRDPKKILLTFNVAITFSKLVECIWSLLRMLAEPIENGDEASPSFDSWLSLRTLWEKSRRDAR